MDREERAAWSDAAAQKLHAEEKKRADEIRMAEIEAEAEDNKAYRPNAHLLDTLMHYNIILHYCYIIITVVLT